MTAKRKPLNECNLCFCEECQRRKENSNAVMREYISITDSKIKRYEDKIKFLDECLQAKTTAQMDLLADLRRANEHKDLWRSLYIISLGLFTVAIVVALSLVNHAF